MQRTLIAIALAAIGGSTFAASDFVDTAQVISAKPIIERKWLGGPEGDPGEVRMTWVQEKVEVLRDDDGRQDENRARQVASPLRS